MIQPQEIMVWYVLPAIRSRLAYNLKQYCKHSQKEVAIILKTTEAAISQYLNGKRASNIKFGNEIESIIKESAMRISANPQSLREEIQKLCRTIQEKKVLCKIHRNYEPDIGKCNVCFK